MQIKLGKVWLISGTSEPSRFAAVGGDIPSDSNRLVRLISSFFQGCLIVTGTSLERKAKFDPH